MDNIFVPKKLAQVLEAFVTITKGKITERDLLSLGKQKQDIGDAGAERWITGQVTDRFGDYSAHIPMLIAPFGHEGDTDCREQWFDAATDFKLGAVPHPVVLYGHGHSYNISDEDKKAFAGDPIGKIIKMWVGEEGVWGIVGLDRNNPFEKEVMEAWENDTLTCSSGALAWRFNTSGHCEMWLIGEVSLITSKTRTPACNLKARAARYDVNAQTPEQARLARIVDLQPASLRNELVELLSNGDFPDIISVESLTDNNSPDGGAHPSSSDSLSDGEDNDVDEIKAMLATLTSQVGTLVGGHTALTGRLDTMEMAQKQKQDCNCGDKQKEDDMDEGDESKQKQAKPFDAVSAAKSIAAVGARNSDVTIAATAMVDGLVKGGQLDPARRVSAISMAELAIGAADKQKSDAPLKAFMESFGNPNTVPAGSHVRPNALATKPAEDKAAAAANVNSMAAFIGVEAEGGK